MSQSTNAENSKSSMQIQTAGTSQPSAQDVVDRFLTKIDNESSTLSNRDVLITLMLLVMNLQKIVMSNEQWYLAWRGAMMDLEKLGMDAMLAFEIQKRLERFRAEIRKTNPMHSMF